MSTLLKCFPKFKLKIPSWVRSLKAQIFDNEGICLEQNHGMPNSPMDESIFDHSDALVPTTGAYQKQSPIMVSAIILNYNGSRYLHRLFSSLNNQSLSAFEIIFVDNASSDDSIDLVKRLCKNLRKGLSIKIIENNRNFGYCKGNNIGASVVQNGTKYLVFLNNDTYVDAHWLRNLVQTAELDNKVGVVGSRIDTVQKSFFSTIALACDFYGQTECMVLPIADGQKASSIDLKFFYCSGVSLLVPKKVFWEVGGFDEALFMYHDEIDLCWRVRLSGYKLTVEPSSICYHVTNSSEHGLSLPVWKYYHGVAKNRIRILLKNYATSSFLKYFPQTVTLIVLRGLLLGLINQNVCYISALIEGFLWNIKNLRGTLLERLETQRLRKVTDEDILAYMLPYSLEIAYFKRLLVHASGENLLFWWNLGFRKGNC
jgi:GT2 family glycosyltransferase